MNRVPRPMLLESGLAAIALACWSPAVRAQEAGRALRGESAVTDSLRPGERRRWLITLEQGHQATVSVQQTAVDVELWVTDPAGSPDGLVDDAEAGGDETVRLFGRSRGTWMIEVVGFDGAGGEYRIALSGVGPVAGEADRNAIEVSRAVRLTDLGMRLLNDGEDAGAESALTQALRIREQLFPGDHAEVASSLTNLADVYDVQQRYADAEPLYERALRMRHALYPGDHPEVATSLSNLAYLYEKQARYADAEPLYESSLRMLQTLYPGDHADVATALNNLAYLYESQGRYGEAEPLYVRALRMTQALFPGDHEDVASSLNNLAELYKSQGRYTEAQPLSERALAMWQAVFPGDDPVVAIALNNLAGLYERQGRYADAEPLYDRALRIREAVYEGDNTRVAASLNNLAFLYMRQGRYADAEPLYQRALRMHEGLFPGNHPTVATSLNNLAHLFARQERHAEAAPLYDRALRMTEALFPGGHPDVATALTNLATLHERQRRYDEAQPLFERALEVTRAVFPGDHPDVAASLNNLARLHARRGRSAEAEALFGQALAMTDRIATLQDPWIALAYGERARLRRAAGRLAEAVADLEQAIDLADELRTDVSGDDALRASFFRQFNDLYDDIVSLEIARGNVAAALEYAERGRARGLLDQLQIRGRDLLDGIRDPAVRNRLSDARGAALARASEFRARIDGVRASSDLADGQRARSIALFADSLRDAEQRLRTVVHEIKNTSEITRGMRGEAADARRLQRNVAPAGGFLLLYEIGTNESFVFVVPPNGAIEARPLMVSRERSDASAWSRVHSPLRRSRPCCPATLAVPGCSPHSAGPVLDPRNVDRSVAPAPARPPARSKRCAACWFPIRSGPESLARARSSSSRMAHSHTFPSKR